MSEKRLDAKNRWRNVVVAFRMSPEEAQELNVKVSLSGLSKQDYIIQCLLKHEIRVVGGMKVAKKVQVHLDTIRRALFLLIFRLIDFFALSNKHVAEFLRDDFCEMSMCCLTNNWIVIAPLVIFILGDLLRLQCLCFIHPVHHHIIELAAVRKML